MSPLMLAILRVLDEKEDHQAMQPNAIGWAVDADEITGGRGQGGRGKGNRVFGKAQQIIFPLTRLRTLGLVDFGPRDDGKSGTAYYITDEGRAALRKEKGMAHKNTLAGYEPENADKIPDEEDPGVGFSAGDTVSVLDAEEGEDWPYAGESGIVQAVCRVHGHVMVDVLIEGTTFPERFEPELLEGE